MSCPCCGAPSDPATDETSVLLAVCDVLVVKALEAMGKYIVRAERSRFRIMGSRPWHVAHTLWQPDDTTVSKALKGAWDVVPIIVDDHGCCGVTGVQMTRLLDSYVHDLVITGTEHDIEELHYRFEHHLALELLPLPVPPDPNDRPLRPANRMRA